MAQHVFEVLDIIGRIAKWGSVDVAPNTNGAHPQFHDRLPVTLRCDALCVDIFMGI